MNRGAYPPSAIQEREQAARRASHLEASRANLDSELLELKEERDVLRGQIRQLKAQVRMSASHSIMAPSCP